MWLESKMWSVNVFLTSTTAVINHFAEGSQIQTYTILLEKRKENLPHVNLLHKILEVLLKDTVYWKESFPSK